ncbi:MAG: hypothetical protein ACXWFY_00530 [Chthoniobacterales bacterium]
MTDSEKLKHLLPLALEWARAQEEFILQQGMPLAPKQVDDARRAGVNDPSKVRILVVDRISPPDNAELAEAARSAQIITDACRAVTIGYGIVLRANSWQDRELVMHQLVHVAQCERSGGLESFVAQYLTDRATCADFTVGSLEDEARARAREICAADESAGC